MFALDVLYWASLFLGASYVVLTLALGGLSHVLGSVQHAFDTGDAGAGAHIGHANAAADVGHADSGLGHSDVGHADTGHTDMGHGDAAHADVGHDVGDGGHDVGDPGHDATGHGHADAGHHGDAGNLDHGAPVRHVNVLAFLNPTMASSFLIGLGGGGVLSRVSGAGALPSLACASVGGGLCYYWAWWLIVRFFGGAQLSSHTRRTDLVGVRAQVTAPIEGSRPGMIAFTIAGSRQTARAITSEDDTITVGSAVRIRRINKDAVVVSRIEGRS